MMKDISVIIPAFNSEKYITYTLDSILNQTNKNAQIIIVDDCSTDRTAVIIKQYESQFVSVGFDFVFLSHRENKGQAACFNTAFPFVNSEYFMWLDSDDVLLSNCFEKKISFMKCNPNIDASICKGNIVEYPDYDTVVGVLERTRKNKDYFNDILHYRNVIWVPGSICVKTSYLFERIPTKTIYAGSEGQNIQLLLPILYKAYYLYMDDTLYSAVSHNDSHSRRKRNMNEMIERQKQLANTFFETINRMLIPDRKKKKYIKTSSNVRDMSIFYIILRSNAKKKELIKAYEKMSFLYKLEFMVKQIKKYVYHLLSKPRNCNRK